MWELLWPRVNVFCVRRSGIWIPNPLSGGRLRLHLFDHKLVHDRETHTKSCREHKTHLIVHSVSYHGHSFVRSFFRSFARSFARSIIYSVIHSSAHSLIHLFIYSFIHTSIAFLIYSFIHSFIHSFKDDIEIFGNIRQFGLLWNTDSLILFT